MTEPYQVAGHIRAALHGITDRYDDALGGTPPKDESDARPKRAEAPVPVSPHILDVRAETHHDLRYFALFILEQVNHGTITTRVDAGDVHALARFIDTWALALAEQHPDDADDARRDLAKDARNLAAIANGDVTHRFKLPGHRCPELVWVGDQLVPCTGVLQALFKQSDDRLPPSVYCVAHPEHQWAPSEWLGLGRRLSA